MPALDAGTLDKRKAFAPWPLPENLGLTVDRDDGLRVIAVAPDSAAAKAGLAVGDELGAAEGARLFGQADLRGVLHRAPHSATTITLMALRDGEVLTLALDLEDGWRETNNEWRMSLTQGEVSAGLGFAWALGTNAGERKRRELPANAMAFKPWFGPGAASGPAQEAGLRASDVVVAVDGESPDLAGRPLLAWWKRRYDAGDEIVLTVLGPNGTRRDVGYRLP